MSKSYDPEKKAGWLAGTLHEPHAVLHTIWQMARRGDRGLIGFVNDDPDALVFSGIRIRIKAKEGNDVLEHPLWLEIFDPRAIRPVFFDFWIDLRAKGLVDDGPGEEDKAEFLQYLEKIDLVTQGSKKKEFVASKSEIDDEGAHAPVYALHATRSDRVKAHIVIGYRHVADHEKVGLPGFVTGPFTA